MNMSETLEILFGSKSRTRLLRFFVLNPGQRYDTKTISEKIEIERKSMRTDLNALEKIDFISSEKLKGKKIYIVNEEFPYYLEFKTLFIKSNIYPYCSEVKKFNELGKVKLLALSGVFMDEDRAKLDLLIVGDDVSRDRITSYVSSIEAEIGKEIHYMQLSLEQFDYRLEMMDRFIAEFLAGSHIMIVNKIQGLSQLISKIKE